MGSGEKPGEGDGGRDILEPGERVGLRYMLPDCEAEEEVLGRREEEVLEEEMEEVRELVVLL